MEYQLMFTEQELVQIFRQSYQDMVLDVRQHMLLTEEQRTEDTKEFLTRQQPRFSILVKIIKILEGDSYSNLMALYKEAEEIMLLARGLRDGECGRSSTKIT